MVSTELSSAIIDVSEDILRYLEEFADRLPQTSSTDIDGSRVYFSRRDPRALRSRLKLALEAYYKADDR